ncbi:MAG: N-acetylmuramoyl-L-alanine amidase [Proteobacteria bacterium]|nr:N-acetylmuramoyl-L-alanine amidase [Pseudomonadota bacterium]
MKKLRILEITLIFIFFLVSSAYAEPSIVMAAHSDVQSGTSSASAIVAATTATEETTAVVASPDNANEDNILVVPPLRTIVIDPGHGGTNEGAIGIAGIHEKHLTLKLALILADRLRVQYPDAKIILTRETDRFLSLNDRISIANDAHADLFLSLHFNSSMNPLAIGFESFYAGEFLEQESDKLGDSDDIRAEKRNADPYAQHMAKCFNHAMSKRFNVLDRGAKPGDYTVLTRARVPAVVLEFGFLSHAEEGLSIIRPEHQAQMIDALVEAINRYQKGRE